MAATRPRFSIIWAMYPVFPPRPAQAVQDLFARQGPEQTGRQLRRLVLHLEPAEPKRGQFGAGAFSGWKKTTPSSETDVVQTLPVSPSNDFTSLSLFVRNVLTRTVMGAIWLIESQSLPVSSMPNRKNQRSISHSGKDFSTAMLSTGDASGSG